MDNENQNNQPVQQFTNVQPQPIQQVQAQYLDQVNTSAIRKVEKVSAWILIFSAVLFALVAIIAIWGAFGSNSNVAWKSASSLGVIAIASLVVNFGARIYEGKRK